MSRQLWVLELRKSDTVSHNVRFVVSELHDCRCDPDMWRLIFKEIGFFHGQLYDLFPVCFRKSCMLAQVRRANS